MRNARIASLGPAIAGFVAMVSVGAAVTAFSAPAARAAASGPRIGAALPACDPDDLPGGVEGPDNDGDECGFTITGHISLPQPSTDPATLAASEFAVGSKQGAAACGRDPFTYFLDEALGRDIAAEFDRVAAPYAETFLNHFLDGSGTPIDVPDNSVLAFEVKQSGSFKTGDQQFQQYAKQQLDLGQQSDIDISNGLHLIHFDQSLIPDLRLGFGGTQGLDVQGSGYQENGRYVGTITYTIRDVYGFYAKDKFLGMGPRMHYLQGVCGAPDYKGGAHYYTDSVTVTVPFNQPIN